MHQISQLEKADEGLRAGLVQKDIEKESMLRVKDGIIQGKDEEIYILKQKIDNMSDEFADMLRETLDKMRERIEISSGNFEAPEPLVQHKIDEFKVEL